VLLRVWLPLARLLGSLLQQGMQLVLLQAWLQVLPLQLQGSQLLQGMLLLVLQLGSRQLLQLGMLLRLLVRR
jgi:hypothetical protein